MAVHTAVPAQPAPGTAWPLRGITSNERYVERSERTQLDDMLPELRASEDWQCIDREVDIRLVRDSA